MTTHPRAVVSASIAYDYIMHFDGSFKDHIIPDKTDVISVSFLLQSMVRQRGGVAGNMAYNMALLGVPVALVGAVGHDFGPYRSILEALGVDLSHVAVGENDFTATAFMNADNDNNQLNAFYPGAGPLAQGVDVSNLARIADYGLVSAGDPVAMMTHVDQIADHTKLIFDPAFQIIILQPDQLAHGISRAEIVMGNEYEFGMMSKKTGMSVDEMADAVPMLVMTHGAEGSEIRVNGEHHAIPVATPRTFGDPTGGGDAYRAGFVAGLLLGKDLPIVGRIAALTSTHAIEFHGPQEHSFTHQSFVERFDDAFPDVAGAITADELDSLGTA